LALCIQNLDRFHTEHLTVITAFPEAFNVSSQLTVFEQKPRKGEPYQAIGCKDHPSQVIKTCEGWKANVYEGKFILRQKGSLQKVTSFQENLFVFLL